MRRFVNTPIMSEQVVEHLKGQGVKFTTPEDCARALLRIAADKTINGASLVGHVLL